MFYFGFEWLCKVRFRLGHDIDMAFQVFSQQALMEIGSVMCVNNVLLRLFR